MSRYKYFTICSHVYDCQWYHCIGLLDIYVHYELMVAIPLNSCIDTVCTYIIKSLYLYDPVHVLHGTEILVHTTGGSKSLDTWGKGKAPAPTHTSIAIHVYLYSHENLWPHSVYHLGFHRSSYFLEFTCFLIILSGRWFNTCKQGSHFGSLSWWCDDTWTLGILRVIFHQLLYQNSAKLGVLLHVGLNYKRTLESHMKSDSFSRI